MKASKLVLTLSSLIDSLRKDVELLTDEVEFYRDAFCDKHEQYKNLKTTVIRKFKENKRLKAKLKKTEKAFNRCYDKEEQAWYDSFDDDNKDEI